MALLDGFAQNEGEAYAMGSVAVSVEGFTNVLTLTGDVDLAMGDDLDAACRQVLERGFPVRIDASELTFIDSCGLGFVTRIIQAKPGGKRPQISGASPLILDTIRIVGLEGLVEIT
jgi:anti-anti-sigma factor